MSKTKNYFFAVKRAALRDDHAESILDMLRYDGATVVMSDERFWLFKADRPPTAERWLSFGWTVFLLGQNEDVARMSLTDYQEEDK